MKIFFAAWLALVMCPAPVWAQENELSLSAGGGGLLSQGKSASVSAFTLTYTRHLTSRLALEGALELFYVKGDDFIGAQAVVVYHFRPAEETRRLIPYVTAGVGATSTDPTEIESQLVIRLGGGVKYYFLKHLGLRLEAREEIIRTGGNPHDPLPGSPHHLLSGRVGVVYRF